MRVGQTRARWPLAAFTATALGTAAIVAPTGFAGAAETQPCRVWQPVQITLQSRQTYDNPYRDVEVWVDLKGPGFDRRCYGFWDGEDVFRVRVLATAPGTWTWRSGSNRSDPGLAGQTGTFTATDWTDAEKSKSPCRRGMIRPTANGHALEYADGTPFFLVADTWWSASTFRYRWYDDDRPRAIGPEAGFKDYVRFRRQQGFNGIAMIAAFPNWANDGQPPTLTADGGVLRAAWSQAGTPSAKDMPDEDGNRPFLFPGKVPGHADGFPDLDRINPRYFHNLDRKIDYLNSQGFVPFIEVARRDIGQAWKKYYRWPDSYTRYIQYVWSRYQANVCLFSPIHFDSDGQSIPAAEWNLAANRVIERFGPPPFGTLASCNASGSSLHWFDHRTSSKWITLHQIGNWRTHKNYSLLTEIFQASPARPCLNGEPYYDGMEKVEGGTATAAVYCRSGMYGSVLSGGLAGHIYGAGGWDGGLWDGNVEKAAKHPIWDVIGWPSGDQVRHLATFVLSERGRYPDLVPYADLLEPGKSDPADGYTRWAYCARTADRGFFLVYFEKDCLRATLAGAAANGNYRARWFNPRNGQWTDAGGSVLTADASGKIVLPNFPGGANKSDDDWGLKLVREEPRGTAPK
ncbi:MAG: apiosidase-like domain-containing protein [Pirellulales bacterium]